MKTKKKVKLKLISRLPKKVKLGKNFTVECRMRKPKNKKEVNAPTYYEFNIRANVPFGKKFRTYSTRSFPGVVQITFAEVV